ncbi:MAG: hypothetical protein AAF639_12845 [Chloroflexota bacterium]
MTAKVTVQSEIIRGFHPRPSLVVMSDDEGIQTSHDVWRGNIKMGPHESAHINDNLLPLIAITAKDGHIEFTCPTPTTAVGVQFWGDGNDGVARLRVDGVEMWTGNTFGGSGTFETYVQVEKLSRKIHTIRVEATGVAGQEERGGIHVTVAAFGCGATHGVVGTASQGSTRGLPAQSEHQVFVPIVQHNTTA